MYITKRNRPIKKLLLTAAIIVIGICSYLAYAKSANIWPVESYQSDTPIISEPQVNKPLSDKESTQKSKTNWTQGNRPTAGTGIIDSDGEGVNKNQTGISSATNEITLFKPTKGQKLSNGAFIEGKSSLAIVQYRLKDNINGVISQGQLTVKNGVFSGTLEIHTNASTGTFEVYSFDDGGREVNNIKIGVKY